MRNHETIEGYIREAHVQRAQYLAEILTDVIIAAWNAVKHAADVLLSVARAKNRHNVFTFDA